MLCIRVDELFRARVSWEPEDVGAELDPHHEQLEPIDSPDATDEAATTAGVSS